MPRFKGMHKRAEGWALELLVGKTEVVLQVGQG